MACWYVHSLLAMVCLALQLGAQVMLVRNQDMRDAMGSNRQLVNGSRGVITELRPKVSACIYC